MNYGVSPKLFGNRANLLSALGFPPFWGLLLGLVFVWVYTAAIASIQFGLCRLIARWFLGARGTFLGVMRPLVLGWFVNGLLDPGCRRAGVGEGLDRRPYDGLRRGGRRRPPYGVSLPSATGGLGHMGIGRLATNCPIFKHLDRPKPLSCTSTVRWAADVSDWLNSRPLSHSAREAAARLQIA